MWRMRLLVLAAVLVGMLAFGAIAVYAGWYWNAQIDVEGVDLRTQWTVTDDPDGQNNYQARIVVKVPNDADASVVAQANSERVVLNHTGGLECGGDGIEIQVDYVILPVDGASGTQVEVSVTANGAVIGSGTGTVDDNIKLRDLVIPGVSC